jgi:hypothetical protein
LERAGERALERAGGQALITDKAVWLQCGLVRVPALQEVASVSTAMFSPILIPCVAQHAARRDTAACHMLCTLYVVTRV